MLASDSSGGSGGDGNNDDNETSDSGNRPSNRSPEGAGRRGAFRQAKRDNNIPTSQQPESTGPNVDRQGNTQPGRQYRFRNSNGQNVNIRDDAAGHNYG